MYQSTNNVSIIFIPMQLRSENIKHFHYQVSILITVPYIPNINVGCNLIIKGGGGNLNKKSVSRHGLPLPTYSLIKKSASIYLKNQN